MGSPDGELSVVILDDSGIANLNHAYLHRSGPTNVIAFSMREGQFSDINPHLMGDVVISEETAGTEAKIAGISTQTRILELLVHGILHLFGYDHETSPEEARRMARKSTELMKRILSE